MHGTPLLITEDLESYREGRFEETLRGFRALLEEVPEDAPARLYTERCAASIAPRPEGWAGVTVLTRR